MAKLCPRGKAAAKRKFDVYPSAYANMYASAVCSGKVTPGGKKKKKAVKKKKGGGLRKWVGEKWVDIGAPKKDGKYQPCGRKSTKKTKISVDYPKKGHITKSYPMPQTDDKFPYKPAELLVKNYKNYSKKVDRYIAKKNKKKKKTLKHSNIL